MAETVTKTDTGKRVDKYLTEKNPTLSRNYLQKIIEKGALSVNRKIVTKTNLRLKENDVIKLKIPKPKTLELLPEQIPLDIIYEDKNILIINKAPGIIVHPAKNNASTGTIVNAILYHCGKDLSGIGGIKRPGIVHRLDKDTSGALMIAKNDLTHRYLSDIIKNRKIIKKYRILVKGKLKPEKGSIEAPIGRSVKNRKKMTVLGSTKARSALSHYVVKQYFPNTTYVEVQIITGRTHQIRVHFQSIGHPVLGDKVYGDKRLNETFKKKYGLHRQFVHAYELTLQLPHQKKPSTFRASLPKNLQQVIKQLNFSH